MRLILLFGVYFLCCDQAVSKSLHDYGIDDIKDESKEVMIMSKATSNYYIYRLSMMNILNFHCFFSNKDIDMHDKQQNPAHAIEYRMSFAHPRTAGYRLLNCDWPCKSAFFKSRCRCAQKKI